MTYYFQNNHQPDHTSCLDQSSIACFMSPPGLGFDTKAIPTGFQGLEPSMQTYTQDLKMGLGNQENADLYQPADHHHQNQQQQKHIKGGKLASFQKRISKYHQRIRGHAGSDKPNNTSVTECLGVTVVISEGTTLPTPRKPYIYNERTGTYRNGEYEFRHNNSDFFENDIREVVRTNQVKEGSQQPYPRTNGISNIFLRYLEAERLKNMARDDEEYFNSSRESVVINRAYRRGTGSDGSDPTTDFARGSDHSSSSSTSRYVLETCVRSSNTAATSIDDTPSYRSSSSCYDVSITEVMEPCSSLESETHSDHSVSRWVRNKLHYHHRKSSERESEGPLREERTKSQSTGRKDESQAIEGSRRRSLWGGSHHGSSSKRGLSIRVWWEQHFSHWKRA